MVLGERMRGSHYRERSCSIALDAGDVELKSTPFVNFYPEDRLIVALRSCDIGRICLCTDPKFGEFKVG